MTPGQRVAQLINAYGDAITEHGPHSTRAAQTYLELRLALDVVVALIEDVEAVGLTAVEDDWPDLALTYQDACEALGHQPEAANEEEEEL